VPNPGTGNILAELWAPVPAHEAGLLAAARNGEYSYSGSLSLHTSGWLELRAFGTDWPHNLETRVLYIPANLDDVSASFVTLQRY
jgi:hypothetical protein